MDMLEQWKEQLKKHPERMEEQDILANAVANLGAGSDAVSSVMLAFVYHMIHDAEILENIADGARWGEAIRGTDIRRDSRATGVASLYQGGFTFPSSRRFRSSKNRTSRGSNRLRALFQARDHPLS